MNVQKIPYIPEELVNIIADYHDYDKYCKPDHQSKFKDVMCDIISMSEVMNTISAKIAKECWGSYSQMVYDDNIWHADNWLGIDADTLGHNFMYNNISDDDD